MSLELDRRYWLFINGRPYLGPIVGSRVDWEALKEFAWTEYQRPIDPRHDAVLIGVDAGALSRIMPDEPTDSLVAGPVPEATKSERVTIPEGGFAKAVAEADDYTKRVAEAARQPMRVIAVDRMHRCVEIPPPKGFEVQYLDGVPHALVKGKLEPLTEPCWNCHGDGFKLRVLTRDCTRCGQPIQPNAAHQVDGPYRIRHVDHAPNCTRSAVPQNKEA